MPILKLDRHDEERELDFELRYQMSLTFEERYRMMEEASRFLIEQLERHGKRKTFEVVKRA